MSKNKKKNNEVSKETSWFKDFKREFNKIIWPKGKEFADNIIVVFAMVIIVSLIIVVLDLALNALTGLEVKGIKKLQEKNGKESTSVVVDADKDNKADEHKNEEKKDEARNEDSGTKIDIKEKAETNNQEEKK